MSSAEPRPPRKPERRYKAAVRTAAVLLAAAGVMGATSYGIPKIINTKPSSYTRPAATDNNPQSAPATDGNARGTSLQCEQSHNVQVNSDSGLQYKNVISGVAEDDELVLWSFATVASRHKDKTVMFARRGDSIAIGKHVTEAVAKNTSLEIDLVVAKQSPSFAPPQGSEDADGYPIPPGKHAEDYIGGLVACGGTLSIDSSQNSTGNSNSSSTDIVIGN